MIGAFWRHSCVGDKREVFTRWASIGGLVLVSNVHSLFGLFVATPFLSLSLSLPYKPDRKRCRGKKHPDRSEEATGSKQHVDEKQTHSKSAFNSEFLKRSVCRFSNQCNQNKTKQKGPMHAAAKPQGPPGLTASTKKLPKEARVN